MTILGHLIVLGWQLMLTDIGDALPVLPRLVLTRWFSLSSGLSTAFIVALALVLRAPVGVRRGLIVGALVLSLSASGFCLYALYSLRFFSGVAIR